MQHRFEGVVCRETCTGVLFSFTPHKSRRSFLSWPKKHVRLPYPVGVVCSDRYTEFYHENVGVSRCFLNRKKTLRFKNRKRMILFCRGFFLKVPSVNLKEMTKIRKSRKIPDLFFPGSLIKVDQAHVGSCR